MTLASNIQQTGDTVHISFNGPLVYENALEGRNMLEGVLHEKPRTIIINMQGVNRIGSDWIAVFVWARQQLLGWEGAIRLISCSPVIYNMLVSCSVHELLNAEILDDALLASPQQIEHQVARLVQVLVSKGLLDEDEATEIMGP